MVLAKMMHVFVILVGLALYVIKKTTAVLTNVTEMVRATKILTVVPVTNVTLAITVNSIILVVELTA